MLHIQVQAYFCAVLLASVKLAPGPSAGGLLARTVPASHRSSSSDFGTAGGARARPECGRRDSVEESLPRSGTAAAAGPHRDPRMPSGPAPQARGQLERLTGLVATELEMRL